LASLFGSEKGSYHYEAWRWTYYIMAATMLVGVITTLIIAEPEKSRKEAHHYANSDYLRLLLVFALAAAAFVVTFFFSNALFTHLKSALGEGVLSGFLLESLHFFTAIGMALLAGYGLVQAGLVNRDMARDTWIEPIRDFFRRYGLKTALLLLALIGLYRITDIVPGVISNVFYQDMGFSKPEIATAVKTFGVVVSILGGFLGGLFASRFGVMRTLLWGAILTAITNLVFTWLAHAGHDLTVMYLAVISDNLAAGFASAAFIAFLSSLTSVQFTAVQYAIFSSLMTLLPKVLGGYSGTMVDAIGYGNFFVFCALIGLPVIVLVLWAGKRLGVGEGAGRAE
ncbi:MAG TPA: MFS transporter, partial [Thiolinea sp.]|nr:MFS transporter [Thiolinea sp.]